MNLVRLYIKTKLLPIKGNEKGETKQNIFNFNFLGFCSLASVLTVYNMYCLTKFYDIESSSDIGIMNIIRFIYFVFITQGGITYLALMSIAG